MRIKRHALRIALVLETLALLKFLIPRVDRVLLQWLLFLLDLVVILLWSLRSLVLLGPDHTVLAGFPLLPIRSLQTLDIATVPIGWILTILTLLINQRQCLLLLLFDMSQQLGGTLVFLAGWVLLFRTQTISVVHIFSLLVLQVLALLVELLEMGRYREGYLVKFVHEETLVLLLEESAFSRAIPELIKELIVILLLRCGLNHSIQVLFGNLPWDLGRCRQHFHSNEFLARL